MSLKVDPIDPLDIDSQGIKQLIDRVTKYEQLSDTDKVDCIGEYQGIVQAIKGYEDKIQGYCDDLTKLDGYTPKKQKSVSMKTYKANMARLQELQQMLETPHDIQSVEVMLGMLKELEQIRANVSQYLDKELQVITL